MKGTSYFWFFHCFIASLSPLSNISPRYQQPVGEHHPKKLHGHHLISCSLSDHALTEGSPKIRMEGRDHTSLRPVSFFRLSEQTTLSPPSLFTRLTLHTTIGDEIYNTLSFEVLPAPSSPYHWQCLLTTAGRSSPKPGPGDSLDYLESSEQG